MRLFLASRLSVGNREAISPMLAELVAGFQGILRPVAGGSEHLTHVFLGERDVDPLKILQALETVRQQRQFRIRVGGTGVFMDRGNPRLVCLDVLEGEGEITELAERTRRALAELFPDLAGYRLKKPHVTLARFRRRSRRSDGRRVEEAIASGGLAAWQGEERVERLELTRSVLSTTGAKYHSLGSVSLGS